MALPDLAHTASASSRSSSSLSECVPEVRRDALPMAALSFAFVGVGESFLVKGLLGAVTVGSDGDLNGDVVVPSWGCQVRRMRFSG